MCIKKNQVARTLKVKMESPRVLVAPIVGFLALQLHRHMSLPWTMELLVASAVALPYMMPPKATREIGIQTDCDEVIVRRRTYTPVAILAIGLVPLMVVLGAFF